jgi:predicted outer membrane repeat protein
MALQQLSFSYNKDLIMPVCALLVKKGWVASSALNRFVMLLICLCLLPPLSQAKTLSVPESAPTIKGALIKAKPGDIVLVSCGTYQEHDIRMKPGVALWSGTLQPGCVTIDAQGQGRHFIMADADSNTALVGFTLIGGDATNLEQSLGGSILLTNSSPHISNCVFKSNTAENGGAISTDQKSNPLFANCAFENNHALAQGGATHCRGKAVFRHCSFEKNTALMGGGLALMPGSDVVVKGCSLRENSAGNTTRHRDKSGHRRLRVVHRFVPGLKPNA